MQPDFNHQINTEGVELVGEVHSRTMREALVAEDYHNSWVAGATHAFNEVGKFVESKLGVAGPYDDLRALVDLRTWLGDMIKAVHETATGTDE